MSGWLVCAQKSAQLLDAGLPSAERAGKWWAYAVGDRSKKTCQRLWEAIPERYRQGHCETSFWAAYTVVIPEEQHSAVGKETGETAHVEHWNNTLRQRLARMTLSFSKSETMHEPCLLLFLHRYNTGEPSCSSEPLPGSNTLLPPITNRHPGPAKPCYEIPSEEWPTMLRHVVENQEPLRKVADDDGVSYETIRRTVIAARKQEKAE